MFYMFINNLFNHIVFIIVMVMFRGSIGDITCVIYFLCIIIVICNIEEFIVFSNIAIIISVYGGIFDEPLYYHWYYNMFSLDLNVY